ncbi:FAD-dependent oxidoreductase [Halomonas sp. Bachu 37]|uniref:NAD(P)/FAD-dependent oxidoreductase n=1 Tax=Halomonas kashgarensis TaxID=3084920 RepID=UPI0032174D75
METTSTRCANTDHLVIIGNGMAGHRLVEVLLKQPRRPSRITVIGAEPIPAYNRILLSPLLAAELDEDALTLHDADWYRRHGVELILGEQVERLDRTQRRLTTHSGRILDYDRLVLATGSRPAMPPVPGIELEGVQGFRDMQDTARLTAAAERGGRAIVVGGGLLGLEAAEGLRKQGHGKHGMAVTVLQRGERLMNRQLDATSAELLRSELTKRGLEVLTGARLAAIENNGQGKVAGVALEDGRRLPADCVVVAAGITPNAELGRSAGLTVELGINVDDTLTTSDPYVHALGECCEFQGTTYGLVEPIWRQAEVLAARLSGTKASAYFDLPSATKLKVSGISLYAFGPTEATDDHEVLSYHDPEQGDYRRLLLQEGRIVGAVLYGDTACGPWYFEQSLAGTNLNACRQALLFGQADSQALLDSQTSSDYSKEVA